jgi:hypothetical protein
MEVKLKVFGIMIKNMELFYLKMRMGLFFKKSIRKK